jgi:UDP-glucose 4-epimerase
MSAGSVLITGVEDSIGRRLAERMAARADLETVIGLADAPSTAVEGVEVMRQHQEYTELADLLVSRAVDTIIHADRRWTQSAVGGDGRSQHVIATMQLAAAAAHDAATVRRVVMVSSTSVYPASSRAPLLHPESEQLHAEEGTLAASLLEAEGFVRDLASTNPNLSVSILRLADLAGSDTTDTLGRLLSGRVVPAVWGFDPAVQLLHVDDAVAALEHAADHELAGVYNVASNRLVRWRRAARLAGKPLIELPFVPPPLGTAMVRWAYRLSAGDDVLDVLRYGRRAATDALHRSGFQPTWSAEHCVRRSPSR